MNARDITLPDGTVRHNVGSDNLSDEDRASMHANEWTENLDADAALNSPIQGATADMLDALKQASFEQSSEELLEQFISKMPPEQQAQFRAAYQMEFEKAVARSRAQHIEFVQRYRGKDAEVKFADALGDQTYFVGFLLTNPRKQKNITVPPIDIAGRPTKVRPGAMYACSGSEARLLERVLASKDLEILNLTPKREGLVVETNWIIQNWSRFYPPANPPKRREAFAAYREPEIAPNDTVAIDVWEPQSINEVQSQPQGE